MVETVGGFTTREGASVLVTPSGTAVGTAEPTRRRASSRGSRVIQTLAPTPTEEALQQSLPTSLRDEPVSVAAPSARTIQTQLKEATPQPSAIGVAPTPIEQALALGTGVREPAPRFDIGLIRRSGRAFFGADEGGPSFVRATGILLSPFQRPLPERVGEREIFIPQFGTITTEDPKGFKETTGFELIRERALVDSSLLIPIEVRGRQISREISKPLVAELQPQITAGTLTLEEAEKQFETKFEERALARRGELEKISRFRETLAGAEEPAFKVRTVAELAAMGIGGLTPVGATAVGVSFIGEGLPKITGGETLIQRGLGVAEVGLGLVGGGLAVKQAERLVDIALVKELQAQRGTLIGKELAKIPEGALFDIKSLRQLGRGGPAGTIKTELLTPVFKTGKDTFSITGGRGRSVLEFRSFETGKPVKITEEFVFGGRQVISPKAPKIISKGLTIELEEFTGGFGRGFVRKRGEDVFREFPFGGISRDIETPIGKITQVQAGRQTALRLRGAARLRRRGILFREAAGVFQIEEAGIIKRLVSTEGESLGIITPSKIKKTPFATTFQELKVETLVPTGISGQIEKQIFRPSEIIKPSAKVSRSLIGIPRGVGGEGLTETQLLQGRGGTGFVQPDLVQPGLSPPVTTTGLRRPFQPTLIGQQPLVKLDLKLISGSLPRQQEVLVSRQTPKFRESLLEAQVFRQATREFQIPRQSLAQTLAPPIRRTPFEPLGDFGTGFFFPPLPSLGGIGERRRPKRRARARVRIAPSFTGIVLGIEEAAIISPTFGVLPGQIRGLETGLEVPKRKKTKKKSKKKKKS